jgi:transposase-like protein
LLAYTLNFGASGRNCNPQLPNRRCQIGKDRKGNRRYRCNNCRKSFQALKDKMLGNMYLPEDKALMCLQMIVEGVSVRSIERVTGVNRNTILSLLVIAGKNAWR